MLANEIQEAALRGAVITLEGIDLSLAADIEGYLLIDGLVALRIGARSASLNIANDIILSDESGQPVGTVCFGTRAASLAVQEMTRWQYVAYLADIDPENVSVVHTFRYDYVIIDQDFFQEYREKYLQSAPIWGGFTHDAPRAPYVATQKVSIEVKTGITLPTNYHIHSLNKYVQSKDAFDRILNLYHLIELLFDYVYMKKIQQLQNNLDGFAKIISAYSSNELVKLRYIITEFCDDPTTIGQKMSLCAPYMSRSEEIFQNHSKDGNPLRDPKAWTSFKAIAISTRLSETDVLSAKDISNKSPYDVFVYSLCSYWIYRLRSSIAHRRVGEFIFVETDEAMIVEFAEPLLLEVVTQIFSSQNLRRLG